MTIITPAFNRRSFLPETIDSVLVQDYQRLEHLVLDDGSTDGTPELLEQYAAGGTDRFRWVRHENIGQSRTINRGFDLARGELLCILNSDDLLFPGAISRLVEEFEKDPSVLAVYPDFRVIAEDGSPIVDILVPELSIVEMVRLQADVGAGVLFTKKMAAELGGWDSSYRTMPDLDFWTRGGLIGRYRHVPEVLAAWRQHSGAITVASAGREAISERFRFLDEFFARDDLPDELRSVRLEAYRNLHFIAAMSMLPTFNRPEDRFIVHDRYAWRADSRAQGRPIEAELLAEREHSGRLQVLITLREAELTAERTNTARLQEQVDRLVRSWWWKVARRVTPAPLRARLSPWRNGAAVDLGNVARRLKPFKAHATGLMRRAIDLQPMNETPYATHVPVLVGLARLRPIRIVMEFGSGDHSTRLFLNREAFPDVTGVTSYEDDPAWAGQVAEQAGGDDRLSMKVVESVPDEVPAELRGVDLILIDDSVAHASRARTIRAIAALKPKDAMVVIHDYERVEYLTAARRFPHVYRMRCFTPQVGVAWFGRHLTRAELKTLEARITAQRQKHPVTDVASWASALQ